MSEREDKLKQQLHKMGYEVPRNIVKEFSQFLQTESDSSIKEKRNQNSSQKTKKKKKASKKKRSNSTTRTQVSIPADFQQEQDVWISKIQQLQQKANAIDLQL
mgnify:CR=1 FL=1